MSDLGERLSKPMPLAVKMEELLQEAQRQRELHIDRLTRSSRSRRLVNAQMVMDDDDVKVIYNQWRTHPEDWVHSGTFERYTEMLRTGQSQTAHLLAKSRFSNRLFKVSGAISCCINLLSFQSLTPSCQTVLDNLSLKCSRTS